MRTEKSMRSHLWWLMAMALGATLVVDATGIVANKRGVRGIPKRRLHPHVAGDSSNSKSKKSETTDTARAGEGYGFFDTGNGYENPKHGEPGHIHKPKSNSNSAATPGTSAYISNSMGVTTQSSQLASYSNKCISANAGTELRSPSYVPIYYQYELLTSPSRDVRDIADTVDKAIQHFLAVWLVDCQTEDSSSTTGTMTAEVTGNSRLTMAPIVGTGVGQWDYVLLGGTAVDRCTSQLTSFVQSGVVCYKVIGSSVVYLDPSITGVSEAEISKLALETLTVGINIADTDYSDLDPDIYGIYLTTTYDVPPDAVMQANRDANQRSWDDGRTTAIESAESADNSGRSGGAKFGIAFAALLCIAIVAFLAIYIFVNRDRLIVQGKQVQNKHHNLDDVTVPSTRYDPSKARIVPDDTGSHGEMNITFRSFAASLMGGDGGGSPESTGTRPMSPDPVTPRHFKNIIVEDDENENNITTAEESNIVSPGSTWSRSDRSTFSDVSDTPRRWDGYPVSTPDDRIRVKKLSKDQVRASHRKVHKPSHLSSPDRSYDVDDTVAL